MFLRGAAKLAGMSTMTPDGIVIAGGGLAAQRCAEALRRSGWERPIRMICAEAHRPYDRPPLSKDLLGGTGAPGDLAFRATEWYEQNEVDLRLGVSAVGLVPAERRVLISDGTDLRYAKLLIATGSRPRMLAPLEGYGNVSVLRTVDDASLLRGVLASAPRLVVLGAGFIGQEVAATARKLGAHVTMIEAAPCPLGSVLGPSLGAWFAHMHRDEGVELITDATLSSVEANGRVQALRLSTGDVIPADHVVVGVGVDADVDWLLGSGLRCVRGVPVDADGRTETEDVFAAGDAAATFDPLVGAHVPGSHWEAAARQGARAARAMLGLEPGGAPLTSFWTDQYGIRIQYLGHARLADSYTIDGDPSRRNFTATFTRAGRPVAALLVDRPRSLPAARKMIENGDDT
jgi:NADPH-dependent 2,4-dienoyl-CoA reductase/sulfur reductase-like enzyme